MNARMLALPAPLANLRQSAASWWASLSPRDRRTAMLAAVVVGAALLWWIAIQPALRTMREAPASLDRLDGELQQMQVLAAESRALRATPPIAQAQAVAALRAATARLGDKARIVVQGDRATITLTGADGESLRSLLTEARGTAHARPVEVQLVRSAKGLDGTLTLSLGGAS